MCQTSGEGEDEKDGEDKEKIFEHGLSSYLG